MNTPRDTQENARQYLRSEVIEPKTRALQRIQEELIAALTIEKPSNDPNIPSTKVLRTIPWLGHAVRVLIDAQENPEGANAEYGPEVVRIIGEFRGRLQKEIDKRLAKIRKWKLAEPPSPHTQEVPTSEPAVSSAPPKADGESAQVETPITTDANESGLEKKHSPKKTPTEKVAEKPVLPPNPHECSDKEILAFLTYYHLSKKQGKKLRAAAEEFGYDHNIVYGWLVVENAIKKRVKKKQIKNDQPKDQ